MSQRRVLEPEVALAGRTAESEVDREAVREQLEKILADPLFAHSKRYPALLRWVVERALEGNTSQLKERTLGVEVFGRLPNYDSNADPVVRITAGEIRKRIAQYYHESGRESEIRIDLPTGTYVPEFHRPPQPEPVKPLALPVEVFPKPEVIPPPKSRSKLPYLAVAGVLPAIWLTLPWFSTSSVERFWHPMWDSAGSTLLCIGGAGIAQDVAPPPPNSQISATEQIRREYVDFSDAMTISRIGGLFQVKAKPFSMRISSSTSFGDLRNGPAVLVGGFNNGWTMRLLSQLRYHLGRDASTQTEWIEDRENPSQRDWMIDYSAPTVNLTEDYAVISRFLDPATERMVVVAAGLLQYGTIAAGEFLTNGKYLDEFSRHAPPNWQQKNMQLVIATKVINGNSGPPSIVSTYFW